MQEEIRWYAHTRHYCSASEGKEILSHAVAQLSLEVLMPSKISQAQRMSST